MRKTIMIICLIITPQTKSKSATLNMNNAVRIAHKNRPSLKALKFSTQASKSNEKVAISGYLPQLSISCSEKLQTYNNKLQVYNKGLQNYTSLQAKQLIYSFSGPKQLKKIAEKGTDIAKITARNHKDLIQYEVEAAFLQTWLLQEKDRVVKSLEKSSTANIKKSIKQDQLNLLGKNTWLTEAGTYARKMSNVYLYTNELSNSKNQLEYLLGEQYKKNGFTPKLVWNYKIPIKLKSLIYYYNKALENRTEIKIKQKEIEQYIEYQTYYKNNYLPEFNLSGQAYRGDKLKNNNIGININWNLFDGAANYYESQKANANKLKALQEKESITHQIKYEVQKAYNELIQLKKQLVAQSMELKQARNQFCLDQLRYKIGEISKVDLETSKYNWEYSKFIWLISKIDTAIKQRELYFFCGYPKVI